MIMAELLMYLMEPMEEKADFRLEVPVSIISLLTMTLNFQTTFGWKFGWRIGGCGIVRRRRPVRG